MRRARESSMCIRGGVSRASEGEAVTMVGHQLRGADTYGAHTCQFGSTVVAATLRMRECWDDVLCDDSWASDARADTTFADLASTLPPSGNIEPSVPVAVKCGVALGMAWATRGG